MQVLTHDGGIQHLGDFNNRRRQTRRRDGDAGGDPCERDHHAGQLATGALPLDFFSVRLPQGFATRDPAVVSTSRTLEGLKLFRIRRNYDANFGSLTGGRPETRRATSSSASASSSKNGGRIPMTTAPLA